jgi:hypothetical protein
MSPRSVAPPASKLSSAARVSRGGVGHHRYGEDRIERTQTARATRDAAFALGTRKAALPSVSRAETFNRSPRASGEVFHARRIDPRSATDGWAAA